MAERLSWREIKEKYPHQLVGMVDCKPSDTDIESAIVKYTDKDTSYEDLVLKAFQGEINLTHTAFDEEGGLKGVLEVV